MEMIPIMQSFVFQQPDSVLIRTMPLITLISLSYLGFSEIIGKHLQYSKFWNVNPQSNSNQTKLSSKTGMLMLYGPACLAGFASFALFPDGGIRFLLLKLALTIHFFKRILEVLFVHKFSGGMSLDTAIIISVAYFASTASMIYVNHLTLGFPEPLIDLKYLGTLIFLIGIYGNFYHHYLLSKLRHKSEKGYKLPKGGLFNLVICPHYLFEILAFFGIFLISQTLLSLSCAVGSALYLAGRSYMTRKWYLSKFESFPVEVKALIPYIF
ncbi:uncharacterized protein LOC130795013 [Actinidia eriantha]|uniref:uncharacterized protein LOC130795013 n=1 Tax=Actinidia eriantha TaxID=165200 RepID=UPI00258F4145|nr:uncharacterized protein LOC130795013 [Actinidia eriantha]